VLQTHPVTTGPNHIPDHILGDILPQIFPVLATARNILPSLTPVAPVHCFAATLVRCFATACRVARPAVRI
jgi:hypothetical protein